MNEDTAEGRLLRWVNGGPLPVNVTADMRTVLLELEHVRAAAFALLSAIRQDERHQLGTNDDGEPEYSFTDATRSAISRLERP